MSEKQSRLAEFKDFVLQGNVVDLAVGGDHRHLFRRDHQGQRST